MSLICMYELLRSRYYYVSTQLKLCNIAHGQLVLQHKRKLKFVYLLQQFGLACLTR